MTPSGQINWRRTDILVAHLGDPPLSVDGFPRLPAFGREPEIGADILGGPESGWFVDRRLEQQRRDRADAGNFHKPPDQLVTARAGQHQLVQACDLFDQDRAHPQHRFDQTCQHFVVGDEFARPGLKAMAIDAGDAQAEHLQGLADRVFNVDPLADQQ